MFCTGPIGLYMSPIHTCIAVVRFTIPIIFVIFEELFLAIVADDVESALMVVS